MGGSQPLKLGRFRKRSCGSDNMPSATQKFFYQA
jgi:hypothetical protein